MVTGVKVADVSDLDGEGAGYLNIPALEERLRDEKKRWDFIHQQDPDRKWDGAVNIQADKGVPFRIVKRVMYSAAVAGYFNVNFAALEATAAAPSPRPPRPAPGSAPPGVPARARYRFALQPTARPIGRAVRVRGLAKIRSGSVVSAFPFTRGRRRCAQRAGFPRGSPQNEPGAAPAMILQSLVSSLTLAAGGHGGEANLILPNLDGAERFLGMTGHNLLFIGLVVVDPGPRLRPGGREAAQGAAGAPVDARDLRADLRDLQDLPDHAGQVHRRPLGLHRASSSSPTSAS